MDPDASRVVDRPTKRPTFAVGWWVGWAPPVLMTSLLMVLVPREWPPWTVMWLLAFAIYCGCKWLTWRRTPVRGARVRRHLGYLLAWPGMDARSFLDPARPTATRRPARAEWLVALGRSSSGASILFGLARFVPAEHPCLVGWVGMVGIVLLLHFGTFHLLSCVWRAVGVEAKPMMDSPLTAPSLGEFWSRRWNTAFRDLTHRFLFRPWVSRLGASGAVFAGFAFSGVVHDLVISWPAGAGYGGPTVFFMLQGAGVLAERSRAGRAMGLGHGWRGWIFTMAVLLAPACLLFHPPFVTRVIVPFLRASGAV